MLLDFRKSIPFLEGYQALSFWLEKKEDDEYGALVEL
jgi:hypothetical protein